MEHSSYEINEIKNETLDILVDCSLQDILLLDKLKPSYLYEQINDIVDNESITRRQSLLSIELEDIEEWLDESCTEEYYDDPKKVMEFLKKNETPSVLKGPEIHPYIDSSDNTDYNVNNPTTLIMKSRNKIDSNFQENCFVDEKISLHLNILMQSMLNTQMSRQCLYKTSTNFCLNEKSLSSNTSCNLGRKRKNDNNILKEPEYCFEKNDVKRNFINSEFFSGKRKTLTNELEESRNHLRAHSSDIFRIFKKQRINLDIQAFNHTNNALMA